MKITTSKQLDSSLWLFGELEARGNLTITREGDNIQLPKNTLDEAVELIESILREKRKEEQLTK